MGNKFTFLTENQVFKLRNMLLTEASAISLHQQFDKVYGAKLIDMVLAIDTSNKKKFAEWVLKSSIMSKIDGDEIKDDYIADGTLKKMYDLTAVGKFQAMSYNSLKSAYDAMLEYEDANMDMSPAYEDEKIIIYVPSSYRQLQSILKKQYGQTTDKVHWCVASSSADEYWPQYTNKGEYHIYLIYNKEKKALFLWNDNPNYSYKMFNNWDDVPAHPFGDANLTEKAAYWLESQCGEVSLYDVFPGSVLDYLLDESVLIIDKYEDDVYYHDVDLYTSDGNMIDEKWCYSRYKIMLNNDDLAVVLNDDRDDYSVVYKDNQGNINAIKDVKGFNEINDYYIIQNESDKLLIFKKDLGIVGTISSFDISCDADDIYTFIPLENLPYILINEYLYDSKSEYVVAIKVEDILNFDVQNQILRIAMTSDYELNDLYDMGYDDDIVEDGDDDNWILDIDANTGDVIHAYTPHEYYFN